MTRKNALAMQKDTDLTSPPLPRSGERTAIPVFRGRVAPVLDTCTCLVILNSDLHRVSIECTCLQSRLQMFENLGIQVIICGAVSEFLSRLLQEKNVRMICGIAGDIDEVIQAYRTGRLHLACYRMPGLRE